MYWESLEKTPIQPEASRLHHQTRNSSHSKKLKHVSTLLRREHAVAVRGLSNSTQPSLTGREDMLSSDTSRHDDEPSPRFPGDWGVGSMFDFYDSWKLKHEEVPQKLPMRSPSGFPANNKAGAD